MQVAVADAGRDRADDDLARLRLVEIDAFDRQRFVRLAKNGGFDLHRVPPAVTRGFAESGMPSRRAGRVRMPYR
ncbi:hypothetical protein D3C83_155170 [compost metagenome]